MRLHIVNEISIRDKKFEIFQKVKHFSVKLAEWSDIKIWSALVSS